MAFLILFLLLNLVMNSQSFSQCTKDTECKFDRVCVDGICVPYESKDQSIENEKKADKTSGKNEKKENKDYTKKELGKRTVWVNPLGFLQFGPTIGYEQRLGDSFFLGIHLRYAAMGLIYTVIVSDNDTEVGMGSAAVGFEAKYYLKFKRNPHSLYYGLFSEFAWGNHKEYEENYDKGQTPSTNERVLIYDARHRSVIFGGTIGYRWRFGEEKQVLLTLGLLSGMSRDLLKERIYKNPDITIEQPLGNTFFGNAEFAIGFEF